MSNEQETARFSDELKERFEEEWLRTHHDHPFIRAMGDGSLSLEQFQFFMRQDYVYLVEFCRVLALAVAKSPDLESMGKWAVLLEETLNSEMQLHREFCADFGIKPKDLEETEPTQTTTEYAGHLLNTAHTGGIEEIAASILPCQWGYDEVGRMLAERADVPRDSFHARWIDGYNAPEYRQVTEWLRQFVDRLGAEADAGSRERMAEVFRESLHHEYAFWDAAWTSGEPSGDEE